jgi:hypothetical protein
LIAVVGTLNGAPEQDEAAMIVASAHHLACVPLYPRPLPDTVSEILEGKKET